MVRNFVPENLPGVAKSFIQGGGVKVDSVVKAYLRRTSTTNHAGIRVRLHHILVVSVLGHRVCQRPAEQGLNFAAAMSTGCPAHRSVWAIASLLAKINPLGFRTKMQFFDVRARVGSVCLSSEIAQRLPAFTRSSLPHDLALVFLVSVTIPCFISALYYASTNEDIPRANPTLLGACRIRHASCQACLRGKYALRLSTTKPSREYEAG